MRVYARCALSLVVGMTVTLLVSPVVEPSALLAQQDAEDVLADPVTYGAWLYEGNCVRCHGPYEDERIGSGLKESELQDKIYGDDQDSCRVAWGRSKGGPLGTKDVKAVTAYILEWEDFGGPPELPELPPQPTPTPAPTPTGDATEEPAPAPSSTPDAAVVALQPYIENDEIAHGAWQYSQNCYRCHGPYSLARMGMGVTDDLVRDTVQNGKVGSSMPSFARNKGGDLKNSEINAIVAYVVEYERLDGPPVLPTYVVTMTQRAEKQNAATGAQIYATYCAVCHGNAGEGGVGKQLAKEWGVARPDLAIQTVVANGVDNTEMRAWSADAGGILTQDQVGAVTAYVLAMPPTNAAASPSDAAELQAAGISSMSAVIPVFAATGFVAAGLALIAFALVAIALLIVKSRASQG